MKIAIEIDNLTEAQARAIEDMLAMWQYCGCIGSSRWTAFYAGGDGNFRPRVTLNGRKPRQEPQQGRWRKVRLDGKAYGEEMYMLDFDCIAQAQAQGPQISMGPLTGSTLKRGQLFGVDANTGEVQRESGESIGRLDAWGVGREKG